MRAVLLPTFAAIDIGSNTVRLEIAMAGKHVVASDREAVRLGDGVFRTGLVDKDAMDRVCQVLARMGRLCRSNRVVKMRAVATAALREARNQAEFLERSSAALGAPVEIISGEEEARLICMGVLERWPDPPGRCLIVDVGGGSTELVVTEGGRVERAYSLPLGALRQNPDRGALLRDPVAAILTRPVHLAIGTSATAAAVVSAAHGINRSGRHDADRKMASTVQIRALYERLRMLDLAGRQAIPGIGPERARVIVPGAAILVSLLEQLGAPGLSYSMAGVRDGIIAELSASL
jgi:exopolyphosphatase/guanosine-5'-triphosphate,3'-diphosphate pyrophosphatase